MRIFFWLGHKIFLGPGQKKILMAHGRTLADIFPDKFTAAGKIGRLADDVKNFHPMTPARRPNRWKKSVACGVSLTRESSWAGS